MSVVATNKSFNLCRVVISEKGLSRRNLQAVISDPYTLHQRVMNVCKCVRKTVNDPRVLYRKETYSDRVNLLLQSPERIDWESLFTYEEFDAEEISVDKKEVSIRLEVGKKFAFRLYANPTEIKKRQSIKDGMPIRQRVGIIDVSRQLDWLSRKGELHTLKVEGSDPLSVGGFKIINAVAIQEQAQISRKARTKELLVHHAVTFEGVLEVTDTESMHHSIVYGVGTGKAFGFGLLSLGAVPN